MPRRLILPLALAAGILAVQPCQAGAAPATEGDCTVLMGGGGPQTPDQSTYARWLGLASDLSHAVSRSLVKKGYRLSDFIIYLPDPDQRAKALEKTLYKTGCSKLLQISFALSSESNASGGAPASGFVVSVSRLEQTASSANSRGLRIAEEYNVEYEFAPGKPKPTVAELAQSIADDLDKAHLLSK
jgi:hypothetical protein